HSPYLFNLTGQVNPATGAIQVSDGLTPVVDGGSDIAFGSTGANQPVTQTFTIQNTGQAALTLDASTLAAPVGFSVATPFDSSVAPGASTTLVVQLDATQGGDFSGQVSFDTSDPNHGTFSFLVSGHVDPPTPGIAVFDGTTPINAGSGYDSFGTATLGTPVAKTFSIENTGTAALTLDVNSLTLPAGFSLVTAFAASVPAGGSTTLVIELTASAGGNDSGQVSFTDNAPNVNQDPFTFSVSGMVNAPAMTVTNSGAALSSGGAVDFGSSPLGAPVTRTLVIANSGTADLTLDPTSLSLPAGYSLVTAFAGDVPPQSTTSLVIQLNATAAGTVQGQVSFNGNDPNNTPFKFLATGVVAAPSIEVLDGATTLPAASVPAGGSTTLVVQLDAKT
ncbi:MAG: choice-of-anchor D domain-containing protein, partial [Candidatus Saccharimonadales bacterium]